MPHINPRTKYLPHMLAISFGVPGGVVSTAIDQCLRRDDNVISTITHTAKDHLSNAKSQEFLNRLEQNYIPLTAGITTGLCIFGAILASKRIQSAYMTASHKTHDMIEAIHPKNWLMP